MLYYFNLTDGDEVFRDEVGILVPCAHAATKAAMEAIAELAQEVSCCSGEWQDWRLEISDPSGLIVETIPLEAPAEARLRHA
ncbi:hypothetical protein AAII07_34680 [Microvirga sp. 0TCS3.31]